jgi:hypothetical protein
MKGGFSESPLLMNQGLAKLDRWTETAIRDRAEKLATRAVDVWPAPALTSDVLDAYRPKAATAGSVYTISDHPHLASGPMGHVFEALRKQVLALDPCVTEEFLKLGLQQNLWVAFGSGS